MRSEYSANVELEKGIRWAHGTPDGLLHAARSRQIKHEKRSMRTDLWKCAIGYACMLAFIVLVLSLWSS